PGPRRAPRTSTPRVAACLDAIESAANDDRAIRVPNGPTGVIGTLPRWWDHAESGGAGRRRAENERFPERSGVGYDGAAERCGLRPEPPVAAAAIPPRDERDHAGSGGGARG